MSKLCVRIGYTNYVMDGEKALALINMLEGAEVYESKWRTEADGGTTHHIYKQDDDTRFDVSYLSEEKYRLYKVSGKPNQ